MTNGVSLEVEETPFFRVFVSSDESLQDVRLSVNSEIKKAIISIFIRYPLFDVQTNDNTITFLYCYEVYLDD